MLFFLIFHEKNCCTHAHVLSKYVDSQKKKKHTLLSSPYFVKKTSRSLKNTVLLSLFLKFFMNNPLLWSSYWVKNVNSLKITLYFWSKKSIGCPSFSIFRQKKITAVVPIFVQKLSILWTTHCYHAHFLSKTRPFSQKTHCSYIFFSNF